MDAVHVSFVHQKGRVGIFGQAVTPTIPKLQYQETDAGVRQIATRGPNNVRVSDWTFPNNNHILVPGITKQHPWMDIALWIVARDDERTSKFQIYSLPSMGEEADRKTTEHFHKHLDYNPPTTTTSCSTRTNIPRRWRSSSSTPRTTSRSWDKAAPSTAPLRGWSARIRASRCCAGYSGAKWKPMRSGGSPKTWKRLHEDG